MVPSSKGSDCVVGDVALTWQELGALIHDVELGTMISAP
jgi:hypothetical protein